MACIIETQQDIAWLRRYSRKPASVIHYATDRLGSSDGEFDGAKHRESFSACGRLLADVAAASNNKALVTCKRCRSSDG